jgi:2'-5' RNA ligase
MMPLAFPLRAAFLAIPLEDNAKWQFQALQEAIREYENILSFQNPQSPHLTLQFWQELMEIEFHQIVKQTEKIASTIKPFFL